MLAYDKYGTEIWIREDKRCPECGSLIWSYNDPSDDPTLGEYCGTDNCKWTENQFLTWEDIKQYV